MNKISVAFFSFTDCQGCYFEFLNLERELLGLLNIFEIVNFKLIKQFNKRVNYDIGFVEGAISTQDEIKQLKTIREKTKYLVALGTCACWGGVPKIANNIKRPDRIVYKEPINQKSIKVESISKYVKVDYNLRGCPFEKTEIISLLKDFVMKKTPKEKNMVVCVECKLRENECLLENGIPCMGPVTYAGCHALCPSLGAPCDNCRGPSEDGNVEAFIELLKERKIKNEDIKRMLSRYAERSEKFKKLLI